MKQERKDDETYPAGYCHFPQYERHFFRGLTAEKMGQTTNKRGFTVYTWIKHYERNEPLDCRVYARAAANVSGMDRWSDQNWDTLLNESLDTINAKKSNIQAKVKNKPKDDFWRGR